MTVLVNSHWSQGWKSSQGVWWIIKNLDSNSENHFTFSRIIRWTTKQMKVKQSLSEVLFLWAVQSQTSFFVMQYAYVNKIYFCNGSKLFYSFQNKVILFNHFEQVLEYLVFVSRIYFFYGICIQHVLITALRVIIICSLTAMRCSNKLRMAIQKLL